MSIKKQYLKSKPGCKVTFLLDKAKVQGAEKVSLVGEFNNWDKKGITMKKQENGVFSTSVNLDKGEYQFKYLINGDFWINDTDADKYALNEFQSENSVVII
jgi:1,4-alpha-glucan branching enzyme